MGPAEWADCEFLFNGTVTAWAKQAPPSVELHHPQHFLRSGRAVKDLATGVFEDRGRALFFGDGPDCRFRCSVADQLLDGFGAFEYLVAAGSA